MRQKLHARKSPAGRCASGPILPKSKSIVKGIFDNPHINNMCIQNMYFDRYTLSYILLLTCFTFYIWETVFWFVSVSFHLRQPRWLRNSDRSSAWEMGVQTGAAWPVDEIREDWWRTNGRNAVVKDLHVPIWKATDLPDSRSREMSSELVSL